MTTIAADGTETVVELDRPITLEEMQKAVGGYIETVPYFTRWKLKPCVAFCNEEGLLMGLATNLAATGYWLALTDNAGYLHGDVIVIQGDDEFMAKL